MTNVKITAEQKSVSSDSGENLAYKPPQMVQLGGLNTPDGLKCCPLGVPEGHLMVSIYFCPS